ncbi:MAG: glycosyltransferase family 4 protein [Vicinamibacterales bacterium]
MRIALFHDLPSGGAKRAVYEWTRRLARVHDVDAYTLSAADHAFCDIRPLVGAHDVYPFVPSPTFRSPLGRLNQLQRWRDLGRLVRIGRQVARRIDSGGYDAVLANPCRFSGVPAWLPFVGCPTVYYLHEPVATESGAAQKPPRRGTASLRARLDQADPLISLYRRRLDALQRRGLAGASRLLANSAFTRDCMAEAYGVDAAVCPCGVDADVFRTLPDIERGRHVLSVGELTGRKGYLFVVEAIAMIPADSRPALRVACNVIDDDERARVIGLAARLGVRVDILQSLDTETLVAEYNRAALFVYAPIGEPFGLAALESMACGTAVVAVRDGGVSESVVNRQTGLLVPRDSAAFAGAVTSLLASPNRARQYGEAGRAHVERHWTWDRSCDELERHLHAVARPRAPEPRGSGLREASIAPGPGGSGTGVDAA